MQKFLLVLFSLSCLVGFGQMTISTGVLTPAQYVNNLVGPGITVSNVTYTGTTQQIGVFGGTSNIGFSGGVVISSGATTEIVGTSTSTSAGTTNVSGIANADLLSVANLAANAVGIGTISSTTDVAILEFDFVPVSNTVSFNFVFSSEEYLTYVNTSFNDVFGFFVAGPGITGPYSAPAGFTGGSANLALVPGTTTPITISTIHPGLNAQYYINNTGNTQAMNGFTTPIPITFDVICGETYHFKFAVADCQDNYLSTAVFLENNSFTSPPVDISLETASGSDTIPEACVSADVLFIRSACESLDTIIVDYTVSGTATNGVDFNIAAGPFTMLPGVDTAAINIQPIIDALTEGTESIVVTVNYQDASGNPQSVSGTLYITDIEPVVINETDFTLQCFSDSIPISAVATGGSYSFTYDWLASDSDSTSDIVSINQNGVYDFIVAVTDECLGPFTDTVTVTMNQTLNIDTLLSFPADCNPIGAVSAVISGATGVPNYTWTGPGPNSPNSWDASVWQNLSSGWYYFTVTDNVCIADDSVFVDILPPPIAQFSANPNDGCTPLQVLLTNNSQNASNFAWDFGNGNTVTVSDMNPQTQTYTQNSVIRLIASEGNCADTAYVPVTISICGCMDPLAVNYNPLANYDDGSCLYPAPTVYVPNVFTPNSDNTNDLFFLTTTNSTKIELTILNRWGNVVYEKSGPNPAWDGKVASGVYADEGVYFVKYRVEGLQDVDGNVQFIEGHGFFHLVRH